MRWGIAILIPSPLTVAFQCLMRMLLILLRVTVLSRSFTRLFVLVRDSRQVRFMVRFITIRFTCLKIVPLSCRTRVALTILLLLVRIPSRSFMTGKSRTRPRKAIRRRKLANIKRRRVLVIALILIAKCFMVRPWRRVRIAHLMLLRLILLVSLLLSRFLIRLLSIDWRPFAMT